MSTDPFDEIVSEVEKENTPTVARLPKVGCVPRDAITGDRSDTLVLLRDEDGEPLVIRHVGTDPTEQAAFAVCVDGMTLAKLLAEHGPQVIMMSMHIVNNLVQADRLGEKGSRSERLELQEQLMQLAVAKDTAKGSALAHAITDILERGPQEAGLILGGAIIALGEMLTEVQEMSVWLLGQLHEASCDDDHEPPESRPLQEAVSIHMAPHVDVTRAVEGAVKQAIKLGLQDILDHATPGGTD